MSKFARAPTIQLQPSDWTSSNPPLKSHWPPPGPIPRNPKSLEDHPQHPQEVPRRGGDGRPQVAQVIHQVPAERQVHQRQQGAAWGLDAGDALCRQPEPRDDNGAESYGRIQFLKGCKNFGWFKPSSQLGKSAGEKPRCFGKQQQTNPHQTTLPGLCRHWVTMKQHRPGNRIRRYFAAIAAMISSWPTSNSRRWLWNHMAPTRMRRAQHSLQIKPQGTGCPGDRRFPARWGFGRGESNLRLVGVVVACSCTLLHWASVNS